MAYATRKPRAKRRGKHHGKGPTMGELMAAAPAIHRRLRSMKAKPSMYEVRSGKTGRVVSRAKKITTARTKAKALVRRGSKHVQIVRGKRTVERFGSASAARKRRSSKSRTTKRRTTARRTSSRKSSRRSSKRRSTPARKAARRRRSSARRTSRAAARRSSKRRSSKRRSSKKAPRRTSRR